MNLEQAKALDYGDILHFASACKVTIGSRGGVKEHYERWRVNGSVKLWKNDPQRIQVPLKYGVRRHTYLDKDTLEFFHLEEDCTAKQYAETAYERAKGIRLTKAFCNMGAYSTTITESPNHISNGHWAIRRSLIANPEDFVSPEAIATYLDLGPYDVKTITQERMDGVFPKLSNDDSKVIEIKYSGSIENKSEELHPSEDRCLFERVIGGDRSEDFVKFNRNYIEHLRLTKETLYGDKLDGSFRNADGSIVIMPIRS